MCLTENQSNLENRGNQCLTQISILLSKIRNFLSFNCIYLLTGLWIGPWSGLWYLKKIEKLRKKRSEKKRKKEEKNVDVTPFAEIAFTSGFDDTGTCNLQ